MKRFSLLAGVVAGLLAASAFAQTSVVQSVNNVSNKAQTFHVTTLITPAATPTDVLALIGSASRTVYVKRITANCTKTTAGYNFITLAKRTNATTGGTSATVSSVLSDSANATATAEFRTWSTNPTTVGSGVSMTTQYVAFPVSTTVVESRPLEMVWGNQIDQYLVLRGVAQSLSLGFAGQTVTGAICAVSLTWMEQ